MTHYKIFHNKHKKTIKNPNNTNKKQWETLNSNIKMIMECASTTAKLKKNGCIVNTVKGHNSAHAIFAIVEKTS